MSEEHVHATISMSLTQHFRSGKISCDVDPFPVDCLIASYLLVVDTTTAMRKMSNILALMILMALFQSYVNGETSEAAVSKVSEAPDAALESAVNSKLTVDNLTQIGNFLNGVQTNLLTTWKAGLGVIITIWVLYSYWLLLGASSYAIFAKDEDKYYDYVYDYDQDDERAFDASNGIDVTSIFKGLRMLREKNARISDDPCYQQASCQLKQSFTSSALYNSIPSFLRKMLRLEMGNALGNCQQRSPGCNWQIFLMRMIQ